MAEVVGQVVAVVLQHVEAFIFDLPSGPGAGRDLRHVIRRDGQAGHESAVIGGLSLGIEDAEPKPVDVHRVLAVAQRDSLDPAVAIGPAEVAGPALGHAAFFQRRALDIFIQRLVAVPLAHEEKVCTGCQYRFGQRLATEQSVAQIDRTQFLHTLVVRDQPAFGGVAFAVLFRPGVVAGRYDHRRQHSVIMFHLAVRPLARQALRATQLLRTEILRPIQRHQGPSVPPAVAMPSARPAPAVAATPGRNRAAISPERQRPAGCGYGCRWESSPSRTAYGNSICRVLARAAAGGPKTTRSA